VHREFWFLVKQQIFNIWNNNTAVFNIVCTIIKGLNYALKELNLDIEFTIETSIYYVYFLDVANAPNNNNSSTLLPVVVLVDLG